mmetsp:Transcript_131179/g.261811  ORF Transcript_131179/g.261811 Transcript_131179/m.261811 type:complete len:114 (-) Transcript_131179:268-609(-)
MAMCTISKMAALLPHQVLHHPKGMAVDTVTVMGMDTTTTVRVRATETTGATANQQRPLKVADARRPWMLLTDAPSHRRCLQIISAHGTFVKVEETGFHMSTLLLAAVQPPMAA